MAFPNTRMRRLRASAGLRGLVRESEVRARQLVLPLFVSEAVADAGRELADKGRELYKKGRRAAGDAAELFERGRKLVEG